MTMQDPRPMHDQEVERPNRPFGHAMTKGAEAVTVPLHGKAHRADTEAPAEPAHEQQDGSSAA